MLIKIDELLNEVGNFVSDSLEEIEQFRISMLGKKGKITINQRLEDRIELNRNVDGLERDDWKDNNYVVVYSLSGDEIYKKAFELLNEREVANQVSLFDFLAA